MRKRTVTTIEMHQIVTVRRTAGASRAWCPVCLQEVEMVPLAEAALLLGVSLRDTCRRVGDDSFHFVETPVRLLAALLLIRQDFGRLNSFLKRLELR